MSVFNRRSHPEADPDAEDRDEWEPGQEWQDEIQPARFNGWNAAGEMLWNFLGLDGSSNWPVLWVGEAIEVPIGADLVSFTQSEENLARRRWHETASVLAGGAGMYRECAQVHSR